MVITVRTTKTQMHVYTHTYTCQLLAKLTNCVAYSLRLGFKLLSDSFLHGQKENKHGIKKVC